MEKQNRFTLMIVNIDVGGAALTLSRVVFRVSKVDLAHVTLHNSQPLSEDCPTPALEVS